jgi:hypothetical protein
VRSVLGDEGGYALLATLVLVALLALATATALTAAVATTSITGSDARVDRDAAAGQVAITETLERLRWGLVPMPEVGESTTVVQGVSLPDARYSVTVTARPAVSVAPLPAGGSTEPWVSPDREFQLSVGEDTGRTLARVVVTRTQNALPLGLSAESDAVLDAPITLSGCGLYAGGDIIGREHLNVGDGTSDTAYPGLFEVPAAHAGGQIVRCGIEEHSTATPPPDDSDVHAGVAVPDSLTRLPGPAQLAGFVRHSEAVNLGFACALQLETLPLRPRRIPALTGGCLVYVLRPDAPCAAVTVLGMRSSPPLACPVVIVVQGDCELGSSTTTTGFVGSLVVTGSLHIAGRTSVRGSVAAREVRVDGPLELTAFSGERQEYPPPLSNLQLASWN